MKIIYSFFLILCTLTSCKSKHSATAEGFESGDQVVRIASAEEPTSLDPRKARDLPTATYLNMLYDGLFRLDFHGNPQPAIAESVQISPDQKIYTFKLRKTYWSNGDPLTAGDFVRTWTSILDPQFPAPNAYQFYVIKGAKAAKEGSSLLSEIGLSAPDPYTLVVELEAPLSYFQELVSTFFFFPIHSQSSAGNVIANGPFLLRSWEPRNAFIVVKNPRYWDAHEVRLDGVIVQTLDEHTALRMFENDELDWAGSPMGTLPQDSIQTLRRQQNLQITQGAGTHWFRFNTEKPPFNNANMRKAFNLAINRKAIVEHITQGYQKPATALVPPALGLRANAYYADNDVTGAWVAFQESLAEQDLSKDDLPSVSLYYGASDRNHKIAQAVQQQWSKALSIQVNLQSLEGQLLREKLKTNDYQIAAGSWFADFNDPINFLEIFKFKSNPTNSTGWENSTYAELLNKSSSEKDKQKRNSLLEQAEKVLMEHMPVAPLFFSAFNYVKDESLLGVYFCDLGYLDFKYAFFGD